MTAGELKTRDKAGDASRTLRVIDSTKSELLTHADPARAAILAAAGGEPDFLGEQRVRKETQIKIHFSGRKRRTHSFLLKKKKKTRAASHESGS